MRVSKEAQDRAIRLSEFEAQIYRSWDKSKLTAEEFMVVLTRVLERTARNLITDKPESPVADPSKLTPGGGAKWHEGEHYWDAHDGYPSHQHSINGLLTIQGGDPGTFRRSE